MDATFCYVDLAGFRALTQAHDNSAINLSTRFLGIVAEALAEGDRLLGMIDDAALVACTDPGAALVYVASVYELVASEPDFPNVRSSIHHGLANVRDGEFEGPAIDLTTRMVAAAHAGQALATRMVAEVADAAGIEVTQLGTFKLVDIERPVVLYDLDLRSVEDACVEDPVCRIEIERDRAPARLRYHHVDYYFCSLECAGDFARAPERYAFD